MYTLNNMATMNLLPELSDLAAAGVAAVASLANLSAGTPANEAMEQLGSQIVGKVSAQYFAVTDPLNSPDLGVSEKDLFVGSVRAGYSGSQKRSNNRVMMDGIKGLLCSVAGQQLATRLQTPAPAPTV